MASTFYIIHLEFRASTSHKWWKTSYAAMASGRGWNEAVAANKEKGFFNYSAIAVAVAANGPICCMGKIKEGISREEFQKFTDGPSGPGFGVSALMNICKQKTHHK
tara:strand:- start:964 stop:1281 length:318 start_codon:yes stop_codon:yes gene_type:complete